MRSRAGGFTLLEVMVATVLTGLVALMAFAAAQVSAETGAVLQRELLLVRSDRAARQMLLDLLHNVRPARARGDTSFALAGDTVTFTAAGAPPLDPEYDWLVSIAPSDSGLVLVARSLGRGPAARSELRLPRIARWQVGVLPPGGREWRDRWVPAPVLPAAVALTLWTGDGPPGPPITVRMSDASAAPVESDHSAE